jgi:hypothetical protein
VVLSEIANFVDEPSTNKTNSRKVKVSKKPHFMKETRSTMHRNAKNVRRSMDERQLERWRGKC